MIQHETTAIWKCDKCWIYILLVISIMLFAIIFSFIFSYMPKPSSVDQLISSDELVTQEQITLFFKQEVDRLNHYIAIISIMVAIFGVFGSVVAIGMGISLSLKERGITEELDKVEGEVKAKTQAIIEETKKSAKMEKDTLQIKFNQYILGAHKLKLIPLNQEITKEDEETYKKLERLLNMSFYYDNEIFSIYDYVKWELNHYTVSYPKNSDAVIYNLLVAIAFLMTEPQTAYMYLTHNAKIILKIIQIFTKELFLERDIIRDGIFMESFIPRYVFFYILLVNNNSKDVIAEFNWEIHQIFNFILREKRLLLDNLIINATYEEFYRITGLPKQTQQGVKDE